MSEPPHEPTTRLERLRRRKEELELRAQHIAERAEAERSRHATVDALYEMVDRDSEVGGGIIAGALAYRLFIWLLPLALVAVAGLGITASASSETPGQVARQTGLGGLVSSSVADAANGKGRWYALIVGIPILVYVTRSVLRVLIGSHRLVWTDLRAAAPKPKLAATLRLLVLLLALIGVSGLAAAVRSRSPGWGLFVSLLITIPYAALWLGVSYWLPHRGAPWMWLLPGAIAFAVALETLQILSAYFFAPYVSAKSGTYGALGTAAVLLFSLYLLSRIVVGAAVLNATLWERRTRTE